MEIVLSVAIGVLVASGVYLLLQSRVFPVVLGLTLFSYAVNLVIFATGRFKGLASIAGTAELEQLSDPLPQALVLTAIVIGFAMTAFVTILSLKSLSVLKTDHIDGKEPKQ
jgi:multicomponent K+:H+ antiporter subunit C